jgi:hypothetical protein
MIREIVEWMPAQLERLVISEEYRGEAAIGKDGPLEGQPGEMHGECCIWYTGDNALYTVGSDTTLI